MSHSDRQDFFFMQGPNLPPWYSDYDVWSDEYPTNTDEESITCDMIDSARQDQ